MVLRTVVALRKVTLPVGVPLLPVTVAVKVTNCPGCAGLAEEARGVWEGGIVETTSRDVHTPRTRAAKRSLPLEQDLLQFLAERLAGRDRRLEAGLVQCVQFHVAHGRHRRVARCARQ